MWNRCLTAQMFVFLQVLSDSNMASIGLRIFVCRVSSVLFYLSMYISILFFGLISIDRCRKTLNPFKGTNSTRLKHRKLLSGAIWTFLVILCLPNVILTSKTPTSRYFQCSKLKTEGGLRWHEIVNHVCQVIFWGNLLTVIVCYTLITNELYRSYSRTKSHSTGGSISQAASRGTVRKPHKAKRKMNECKCVPGSGSVLCVLCAISLCPSAIHNKPDPSQKLWLQTQALLLSAEGKYTFPLIPEFCPGSSHLLLSL